MLREIDFLSKMLSKKGARGKCLIFLTLKQWFSTFLGLQHPTKEKYNLRHPVVLRCNDILKISLQSYSEKRFSSRYTWAL